MPATILPDAVSLETRADLHALEPALDAALAVIRARHSLASDEVRRASTGSSPVYLLGDRAVKLVPPQWRGEFDREVRALEAVQGALTVATQSLCATGMIDAWSYMITERIEGVSLRDALSSMDLSARVRVSAQVGEALASLHAVSTRGLEPLARDWVAFARDRSSKALEFQRRTGLHEAAVARIPAWLDAAEPLVPDDRRALVHGDLHHEHAIVAREDDQWNLVAILDFGDAVIAHPEYDLVTPAFFVAGPHDEPLRALFSALSFDCDERASRRLTAWSALHSFNALARFLPAEHDADALEQIRQRYWPVTHPHRAASMP